MGWQQSAMMYSLEIASSVSFRIFLVSIFSCCTFSCEPFPSFVSFSSFPLPNEKDSSFFQLFSCFSLKALRSASPSTSFLLPMATSSSSWVWKLCRRVSLFKDTSSIRIPSALRNSAKIFSPSFWLALASLRRMEAILARARAVVA